MKHELWAICLAGTFLFGCGYGCKLLAEHQATHNAYETPPVIKDWRPDIRHCHVANVDLWECIKDPGKYKELREAMKRTDI